MAQTIDLIKNTSFETKMDTLISAVGSGTPSYTYLADKPSINGNTLEGNKTNSQLGISSASYKTISVGATDVNATTVDDDLSIIAGTNVTIIPDAINKTITFSATDTGAWGDITGKPFNSVGSGGLKVASGVLDVDTTKVQAILSDATTSISGKMSATDKAKLDGIATGANNYSLPTASSAVKGGAKIASTDGLTMDGETLKAAVKGLITSENDFNAQTESTSQAVDSYLAKKIITDIAGSGIAHNSIYRGKYLGTSVTTYQYAAISAGTFDDLFIGDYWTMGGVNYRIAAFDYYWNCGDTPLTAHHAVIVPEKNLYKAAMNTTDTTTGGYVGSQMYTTNLEQAKTTIKAAFVGHVVNHRIYLVNAVANGYSSGGVFVDSEVNLMNEQMVYGSGIFSPVSTGSAVPTNYRVEKNQLPLFAMNPAMLNTQQSFWLRDVITASDFAGVRYVGDAYCYKASVSLGVRPTFCIS